MTRNFLQAVGLLNSELVGLEPQDQLNRFAHAKVKTASKPDDFERLIADEAVNGLILHSWGIHWEGFIIAVFVPMDKRAMDKRNAEIAREVEGLRGEDD